MSSVTTTIMRKGRDWYQSERIRIMLAADSPELDDRFRTNGRSVVALRVLLEFPADHELPAHSAVNGAKGGDAGGDAGGGGSDGSGSDGGG